MSLNLRQRVIGMLQGVAIGDALGQPVEGLSAQQITDRHGEVKTYLPAPPERGYLIPAGKTTDDTQLTLAVARAFIECGGQFDMDRIAAQHVQEFFVDNRTWGNSTRDAVQRLSQGARWYESAPDSDSRGSGVIMKCSPITAWWMAVGADQDDFRRLLLEFAYLTHGNPYSASACFAHTAALGCCLATTDQANHAGWHKEWVNLVRMAAIDGWESCGGLGRNGGDVIETIDSLYDWESMGEEARNRFAAKPFEAHNSIGISYMCFLRKPTSIDALYDVVNAGGDADTNGGLVGGMLGALNGPGIFPQHLVDGCQDLVEVTHVAEKFCDCLGLE